MQGCQACTIYCYRMFFADFHFKMGCKPFDKGGSNFHLGTSQLIVRTTYV